MKKDQINKSETSQALFKNTGIIAIGQISTRVINFLLLPLYTALLTTEQYGLIDLLHTYASLIIVVVGLQLSQALFRFMVTSRNDIEHTKKVVSTVFFSTAIACMLYVVAFYFVQKFIDVEHKWFLVIFVIVTIWMQTLSGVARGMGNNTLFAIGNFLSASFTLVFNVILIAVFQLGVGAMLWAYIIGPLIGVIFLFFTTRMYTLISFDNFSKSELKVILCYSFPLIPNELSWSIIHASDRVIVSNILSVAVNGLIAVASKFSVIYTTFFSIFNTSWTEQVVLHYKDEGGKEYIEEMFNKVVVFFACVAIGIIAMMPFVFRILINEQFSNAYGLIPLYLIAVFFNAIIGMLSAVYLVENETRIVALSTMVAAGINLVVDIALIKVIGVYAAPISSICGYAFVSVWRLIDVNKRHCRISMSLSKICLVCVNLVMAMTGFYCKQIIVSIILLCVVVGLSIILNREFLLDILNVFVCRLKEK